MSKTSLKKLILFFSWILLSMPLKANVQWAELMDSIESYVKQNENKLGTELFFEAYKEKNSNSQIGQFRFARHYMNGEALNITIEVHQEKDKHIEAKLILNNTGLSQNTKLIKIDLDYEAAVSRAWDKRQNNLEKAIKTENVELIEIELRNNQLDKNFVNHYGKSPAPNFKVTQGDHMVASVLAGRRIAEHVFVAFDHYLKNNLSGYLQKVSSLRKKDLFFCSMSFK